MKHFEMTHLLDETPDTVVAKTEGNDLRTTRNNPTPALCVATDILNIGLACNKRVHVEFAYPVYQLGKGNSSKKEQRGLMKCW